MPTPSLNQLPKFTPPAAPPALSPPAKSEPAPPSPIESSFVTSEVPAAPSRSLEQFGYNLFEQPSSTFAPVTDVPVGPDYVLGPGDTLIINVWGLIEQSMEETLDREGKIFLPKVGPVSLWGLTIQEAKALIQQQLSRYFSKFQLSISMGSLRTIKVFVLGEAVQPGAYEMSALSTVSNALFAAGGPTKIGTLRRIRHLRNNQLIGEVDFYDLLLRGDKSHDVRVESGDVIFIPTIGPTVGITGNVKRPAIYEMIFSEGLGDLIRMAGGIMPTAYLERVQIERVKNHQEKVLIDLDLSQTSGPTFPETPLQDGDLVKVFAIHGRIKDVVSLVGSVRHPGDYEYKDGMRVIALLPDPELLPESYLDRAEVIRLRTDFTNEVIPFSIRKLKAGEADQDIPLKAGDRVVVSTEKRKAGSVTLSGEVLRAGTYTLTPGERLSSVIRRAGGYTSNAYLPGALFIRKTVREREETELNTFMKLQEERLLAESSAIAAGGGGAGAVSEQQALAERRDLLKVIASKVSLGRVVVHLDQPDKLEGTTSDTILEDGDSLHIPSPPSSVVVLGSVRNSTGILYREGADVSYYINQAGGPTEQANPKAIYVIKADGSALPDISMRTPLDRGDAVIVPISTEAKYRALPLWRDVATILGQFAITIAAIHVIF
jgi:polysaccharide export outer membrane protein